MPDKTTRDAIPDKTYLKDEAVEGTVIDIDDDINSITITIPRTGLVDISDRNICSVSTQASYDNGATWIKYGGFTIAGGVYRDRLNRIVDESTYTVNLRPGRGRKIKVLCRALEQTKIKVDFDQRVARLSRSRIT